MLSQEPRKVLTAHHKNSEEHGVQSWRVLIKLEIILRVFCA
jgi:hypothetical protein